MSKYIAIATVFIVVFVVILGVGIGLAQDQGGEDPTTSEERTTSDSAGTNGEDPNAVDQLNTNNQINETDLEPSQTYNAELRIPGVVLKPRDSIVEWYHGGGGGCIYATSGSTTVRWNTGVYLPQGSTVKYLRMFVNDANAARNSNGFFTVYDLFGHVVDEWGVDSSGSAGETFWTSDVFTHTVDYGLYSYAVNWQPNEFGNDMQLCGFRIYYHTPPGAVALPAIMNTITGP